jgi:hypothetical protein
MKPHRFARLLFCLALSACATGPGRSLIPVSSSAEPSAPPDAPNLMIRLDTGNSGDTRGVVDRHVADYLSDGTVIRVSEVGLSCSSVRSCGTLESNTLTPAGLATLRALLAKDFDLLAEPRNVQPQMLPDKVRAPRADVLNTFVLERPDGSRYTVTSPSASSFNASTWAPDLVIERLNALAEALVDPATLIGAGGLANPAWETYRPARMAVFIALSNVDPQFVSEGLGHDISLTGWPFEGTPETFGTAYTGPGSARRRCAFLPSADAMAAIASLESAAMGSLAAGMLTSGKTWWSGGGMLWDPKSPTASVDLSVVALLPEDTAASCVDARSY